MSLKLYKKSAWGNTNVQLPEEEMLLDMDNPIHAAIKGSLVREAQRAEGPEDIVNVMKLAGCVTSKNSDVATPGQTKIGVRTITTVSDGKADHEIDHPQTLQVYLKNGFTIKSTRTEDVYDG